MKSPSDMQPVRRLDYTARVVGETLSVEFMNLCVSIGRSKDGKLFVAIDTEDLPDEDTVGKYAVPSMRVHVNDATVSED